MNTTKKSPTWVHTYPPAAFRADAPIDYDAEYVQARRAALRSVGVHRFAAALYARAKYSPRARRTPMCLAIRLWGYDDAVQVVPAAALGPSPAVLIRRGGRRFILVAKGVRGRLWHHFVGHELAHAVYHDEGVRFVSERIEEWHCNVLGAALAEEANYGRPLVARAEVQS